MHTSTSPLVLAGDVGGTKTLLGLFEPAPRRPRQIAERRYDTDPARTLDAIVMDFLQTEGQGHQVAAAAFGVAGPVVAQVAQLTNHSWTIDANRSSRILGAPVQLLNDVEALAYALDALDADDVLTLQAGKPRPDGTMAVIAAGTGLGQSQLVRVGGRPVACASEGGHADFAPRHAREDELVRRLRLQYGRATVEHVLSGPGLVHLHQLTHQDEPCAAATGGLDLAATVTAAGLERRCERCHEALTLFVSAYASEAGNLALRALAAGGLFIGGGIAPRILPALQWPGFLDAFRDKPPMSSLLADVPVHVIVRPAAGLLGAAAAGQRHLR
jgi:glucokinase